VNALCPGKMTERQKAIVEKAWSALNKDGSDNIDGACMLRGGLTGQVSKDDFCVYFRELAVSVPHDQDFVRLVESHVPDLSEDKAAAVFNDQVRHLIFLLRQRLITLSNQNQEEYQLRNIFRQFDLDNSGALSFVELKGMLGKLGVTAPDE
jgi:Ca2+-binding EF-hand superfamily protein